MEHIMKKCLLVLFLVLLTVSVCAQDTEWELTETWEVTFRTMAPTSFTIDYPDGWFADKSGRVTALNELEVDHQNAFEGPFATQGYSVSLVFLRSQDLRELPTASERTLEDLLAMNSTVYEYEDPVEISETSFLSWPALQVRTVDGMGNHINSIPGFLNEAKIEGYIVTLAAPSAEALDAFLPAWEAMLGSITITKGYVNLGDYGLQIDCQGSGSPAVILEPNLDPGRELSIQDVAQREIAEFTQVCVHSLVAHGDELHTIHDYVVDIHDLLAIAGVEGPYVMVGPDVGGLFVLEHADAYPDKVAGIVLVDCLHPDVWARLVELDLEEGDLSAEGAEAAWAETIAAWMGAGVDFETSIADVAGVESLGDMPLVVLSPEIWDLADPEAEELQTDLAMLSTNSTLIVLEGVGHGDIGFRTEVIDAIRQMVEEVRAQEE
jgi:hypothetical protein